MLKVNEYFDGNVKSIAFSTATLPATVGVMAPGDYLFNTADKEAVTVISGAMHVKLPGEAKPRTIQAGESFNVAANSAFDVSIESDTAYLCLYG
jgi:purine/pyrimidine-nucleoside phosphorylase